MIKFISEGYLKTSTEDLRNFYQKGLMSQEEYGLALIYKK